ncbi:tubulin/FtsZ family protein [Halospeciosus flavus]|uniref:Tubulin-like protein CetZ n=1 Tax=Halospeciosus flavus TaxID=3032283 RepID=A0ABD5Z440_9EURY|nr:tubulin/FtsZ family protein [Halospeciosus flavus]
MQLVLIGVGQAGGKIVDALLQRESADKTPFIREAVAINTAEQDLRGLDHVPEANRHLVGQSRVGGHGVGGDNELAAEIAQDERSELVRAIDVPATNVDAFLVVAGLGGGTGSGMSPVLVNELQRIHTEPIYGLGILPSEDEGGLYSLNAARSLRTLRREADNVVLIDNDAWRSSGESLGDAYESINREIARRLAVLFSAGELSQSDTVGESVLDASEIINTLRGGGVSALGYGSGKIDTDDSSGRLSGLLGSSTPSVDETTAVNLTMSTIRKAVRSQLSVPCDVASTGRALVLVSGPPAWLSRKGIERGRQWVEETTQCLEVRGGDYPLPESDHVAAVVLLSDVKESERLDQLEAVAADAQGEQETHENDGEVSGESLSDDKLDGLF